MTLGWMVFRDVAIKAPVANQALQVSLATPEPRAPLEPLETQDCQDLRAKKVGFSYHHISFFQFAVIGYLTTGLPWSSSGLSGPQGKAGLPGPVGETGAPGACGRTGERGVNGQDAAPGCEGQKGEKGKH